MAANRVDALNNAAPFNTKQAILLVYLFVDQKSKKEKKI